MKILHFADLHLGVENYGKIDPETGLSSRLLDFLAALDKVVDFAIDEGVDLVLFCGDAYKSREPSQTQQREFAVRINRLSSAGIPLYLLVGNHDMPNAVGRATATEIFHTLQIPNVYVSGKPEVRRIETKSGPVQIASLPWLRRSSLIKREDVKYLSIDEINAKMQQVLTNIITSHVAELDPAVPAVLAAHVWVSGARPGSERSITIGQEHVLLPGNIANPAFDYIALGHIHKRQVVWEKPPAVYSGSLERVDFGEEKDDKGFYLVEISGGASPEERSVSFEFVPVVGRPFLTIEANVEENDPDPTSTIVEAIRHGGERGLGEAVVRLRINLPSETENQLREAEIREALKDVYHVTVSKEVGRKVRPRLEATTVEEIEPLEALRTYLEKSYPPERAKVLLDYGERLLAGNGPVEEQP